MLTLVLAMAASNDWLEHYRIGESRLQGGQTEAAIMELKTALTQAESEGRGAAELGAVLNSLGRAEYQAGQYRSAAKHSERLVLIWKDGSEAEAVAHSNLGQAYAALGEHALAEQSYRRALKIQPRSVAIMERLGQVLCLEGRYREAETILKTVVGLSGQSDLAVAASAWNSLAAVLEAKHQYGRAAEALERAVEMAPIGQGRARMLANLGTLSWKNGAKRQAAAYLRRALSEMEAAVGPQHPDIVHILDDYALVLKKTGLKPESEGIAKRAAEMRSSFAADANAAGKTVDWRDLKK